MDRRGRTSAWLFAAGFIAACGILAGIASASDTKAWRLISASPAYPPTLRVPIGVYDPVRHRVLAIDTDYQHQQQVVRVFDPSPEPHWSTLAVSSTAPEQEYLASIVYDPVRDRLLRFGGETETEALDVWALTLHGVPAWQQIESQRPSPRQRFGHSTIYDPAHDRVILFGGAGYEPGVVGWVYHSDVWAFSLASNTWTALLPDSVGPGGREGHGALFDPAGDRMLLFGGHFDAGTRSFLNDLWELSLGGTIVWSELHPTGPVPGARSAFGTVYDPVRRRMLIHGGVNEQSGVEPDEVWALSLAGPPAWTRITTADMPRGRSYPVDVYDPVEDRLLACGGGGYPQSSALSLSDPVRWDDVLPTRPLKAPGDRSGHIVVRDTRRDRFVVIGGGFSPVDSSMWSFDADGPDHWMPMTASYLPTGPLSWFNLSPIAVYDSLGDRILLCDGSQAWSHPAAASGTWTPLGPPRPRDVLSLGWGAGLALDTRRNRLIMTGGLNDAGHVQYETDPGIWSLSLGASAEWSRIGTMPQECGSVGHDSYYDPIGDRLVLFGGLWMCGKFAVFRHYGPIVWTTPLDSSLQWSAFNFSTGALPPAPPDAHSAFDPTRGRLYLFADSLAWTRGVDDTAPWAALEFSTPRAIVASPVVYDPIRDQVLALFASVAGSDSVQAWALALGPLSVSLVESTRSLDALEITWRSTTAIGRAATIERREAPGEWSELGPIAFEAQGIATFTDHGVHQGHDYEYRVSVADGDSTWHSQPVLVAQPTSLRLALLGARPNPAVGSLQLAFSLPAAGAARLEIFDLRGRRCLSREVGALGAGMHWLTLAEAATLQPGVYFARLERGRESRTARVILMR